MLFSLLLLFGCRGPKKEPAPAPSPSAAPSDALNHTRETESFEPEVAVQAQDYRDVRASFRTKLTRQGSSPQKESMPDPPDGVTAIKFPSGDLELDAWVSVPAKATKKWPAVVFLHGGFGFSAEDWEMAKPYRDAGYVVLVPLLRGENGQAGNFTLFYDEVDDVLAAGEYLRMQPYVDSARLFIAGHSVGGTLTLLAVQASDMFHAAASFSGSPDQVLFTRFGISKDAIPFDVTDKRELEVRSPLSYAKSFKCPTRIYYGSREARFEKTSLRTAAIAKESGMDVDAVPVEGGHMDAVPAEIKLSLEFFGKR
jgi:dipeptidyl aminopeptidase/acylaminoacyl peptidase